MKRALQIIFFWIIGPGLISGQSFDMVPVYLLRSEKPIMFRQILPTTKGTVLIANSLSNLAEVDKMQLEITWATGYPVKSKGNKAISMGKSDVLRDLFELNTGIKLIAEGPGKIIYFVTDNNHFGFINYIYGKNAFAFPPFIFPENRNQLVDIRKIWLDNEGNLFVGTNYDTLYIIEDAANINVMDGKKWLKSTYKTDFDKDSNIVVINGIKKIKKKFLGKGVVPTCFATDNQDDGRVLIGTNKGLFTYHHVSGESANLFAPVKDEPLTITHILSVETSAFIWISSLEKGMGRYTFGFSNPLHWFPYKGKTNNTSNPIQTFCRKSMNELFVAPLDSTPAIFNTESGKYNFLIDSSFKQSKNSSADIKVSNEGIVYLIKGDRLFRSNSIITDSFLVDVKLDTTISQVVILDVAIGKTSYLEHAFYEIDNTVSLKYYENHISILYAGRGFSGKDNLEFAWKLEGRDNEWSIMPYSMMDEKLNGAYFTDLDPGKYTFLVKVRKAGEDWRKPPAILYIIIEPPFWQTWWFWLVVIGGVSLVTFIVTSLRAGAVRKQERERAKHEKELLEMEARALRAQMNPHFIFNCLNSIKALMQEKETDKGIIYLTTFSKLIRTLFQNSDKTQISLYDEVETCRLYTQLEAMRLNGKLKYSFNIDPNLDLKSVRVPALIIQPFIENAIWHGVVPKEHGTINIIVKQNEDAITCEIDDDGIGREMSKLNKPIIQVQHESKGVNLSQARLNLEKMLNETNASIEVIDKYENGKATGTRIILKIIVT